MNEQHLQQIITLQQALAAAAAAAVINSLLGPQQQQQLDCNNQRIQDLSLQLQQHQQLQQQHQQQQQQPHQHPTQQPSQQPPEASLSQLALNLNNQIPAHLTAHTQSSASPNRSPVNRISSHKDQSSIKRLKRHHHHQQAQHSPQAQQHSPQQATSNNSSNNKLQHQPSTTPSSSSTASFATNNVNLPRKLVRGQDVWLGRGAEQTRQILKCMWCGQSFRTLAEMTQHMKITQHYTNIISQEQITSWKQPESQEANNKTHGGKTSSNSGSQARNNLMLDDTTPLDEQSSEKFNDSDQEDTFSNDDELDQRKAPHSSSSSSQIGRLEYEAGNTSHPRNAAQSSQGREIPPEAIANTRTPLTRSKRREIETLPIKIDRDQDIGEIPPVTGSSPSSSRQRQSSIRSSSSNLNSITNQMNEDDETSAAAAATTTADEDEDMEEEVEEEFESTLNDGCKTNGKVSQEVSQNDTAANDDDEEIKHVIKNMLDGDVDEEDEDEDEENECEEKKNSRDNESEKFSKIERTQEEGVKELDNEDDVDGDEVGNDNKDELSSENNDSALDGAGATKPILNAKGETGDPLSALETMVEKSFDPRLRPGMASGGILQRLGIDEEVCPPWQHINYANWYAAAAYGHPMAAALLAAGLNLQNGLKLSKNITPKKNED